MADSGFHLEPHVKFPAFNHSTLLRVARGISFAVVCLFFLLIEVITVLKNLGEITYNLPS